MVEMPEVFMPDQSAPGYPAEFRFSPLVENYYRGIPRALRGYWDAFGSGSAADMPLKPATRGVEGTAAARIQNYEAAAAQLAQRFRDLQKMDEQMAAHVRRSLAAARAGRERVEAAIHRINADAGTVPVGSSKGDHILDYVPAGLDRADQAVVDTAKAQRNQALVAAELVHRLAELTQPRMSTSPLPLPFSADSAHPVPGAGETRPWSPANPAAAGTAPMDRGEREISGSHPPGAPAAPTTPPAGGATTDPRRSDADDPGRAGRNSPANPVPATTGQPVRDASKAAEPVGADPERPGGRPPCRARPPQPAPRPRGPRGPWPRDPTSPAPRGSGNGSGRARVVERTRLRRGRPW